MGADAMASLFAAMQAVAERGRLERPTEGHIECPLCGRGRIYYSVASNGHTSGQCTTDGCLAWIQ